MQLLKFLWGQLYNGKTAHRYGLHPTSACRLCGAPDSCTHIAGACPANTGHVIKKHNAAIQLVHATIRQASKGGAALHRSPLTLLSCDAGIISQTTPAQITALLSPDVSPPPHLPREGELAHLLDLVDPDCFLPTPSPTYTDVTMDPKRILSQLYEPLKPTASDTEATTAPSHIPPWVLPIATTNELRRQGLGVTPDLIYARGVPNTPNPDPSSFDKATCSLLLIEVGFGSDLNLKAKIEKKNANTNPSWTNSERTGVRYT